MRVGQLLQRLGIVHGGMVVRHLDVPPAFQRGEQHEQVGSAVTLVLVIVPGWLAGLCRERCAGFLDELLRGLVQADHRAGRIMRALIDFQYVFHVGHESGVGVRRDHPLFLQVGLECVFFSVRPIVLSLARSTMFSSTTAVSSSVKVHRLRPLGGREQASAISLASALPSKMRGLAEFGECLWVRGASMPPSTSCWRVRAMVSMLVSNASAIWPSLQASPASEASAFSKIRAFSPCRAGLLPFWINPSSRSRSSPLSLTMYFFTAGFCAVTMHPPWCRRHRFRDPPQNQRHAALELENFHPDCAGR